MYDKNDNLNEINMSIKFLIYSFYVVCVWAGPFINITPPRQSPVIFINKKS